MDRRSAGDPALVTALRGLFADLSDLIRKEVRLARAELKQSVSNGLQAGIWMAAAGLLGLIALLLLIQAIVFGIASLGLGVGWASLLVAVALGAAAAGAFFYGRSLARDASRPPKRTIKQLNEDVTAVREQFT